MAEPDTAGNVETFVVGAAMDQGVRHLLKVILGDWLVLFNVKNSCDTTHTNRSCTHAERVRFR